MNSEGSFEREVPQKISPGAESAEAFLDLEYLRLPKGFHVRDANYLQTFSEILAQLRHSASLAGLETVMLPSLGYASTFIRGAETTGDKTFDFEDRKGRRLMLSPDSTPAIFRWYLENYSNNQAVDVAWFAPLFRYRNFQNRGFHQFGFAYLNRPGQQPGGLDWPLIEASNLLVNLIQSSTGIEVTAEICCPGKIKDIVNAAIGEPILSKMVLRNLQKAKSTEEKIKLVTETLPAGEQREALAGIFSGNLTPVNKLHEQCYQEMHEFGSKLTDCAKYQCNPGNLHSSEIISGLGIAFKTLDGCIIGDGGRYDIYGETFDPKIHSVISVCSGVEALYRSANSLPKLYNSLLSLVVFSEFTEDAHNIARQVRESGISTRIMSVDGTLKKTIREASKNSKYIFVYGSKEKETGEVELVISSTHTKNRVTLENLPGLIMELEKA